LKNKDKQIFGLYSTFIYFSGMKEFESVKIDARVVKKVRRHAAKNKQTIGGLFELGIQSILSDEVKEWKEKAEKWDALGAEVSRLYPLYQMSDADKLDDIAKAAAVAFDLEEE
jgi:hypothetical protein